MMIQIPNQEIQTMTYFTKNIRFPAIITVALFGFAGLAGTAEAMPQTHTGYEFQAEQAAIVQYAPRFAAIAETLVACDVSSVGVGFIAQCSVRVYDGHAGDWQAYHSTVNVTCKSFLAGSEDGCKVQD